MPWKQSATHARPTTIAYECEGTAFLFEKETDRACLKPPGNTIINGTIANFGDFLDLRRQNLLARPNKHPGVVDKTNYCTFKCRV